MQSMPMNSSYNQECGHCYEYILLKFIKMSSPKEQCVIVCWTLLVPCLDPFPLLLPAKQGV